MRFPLTSAARRRIFRWKGPRRFANPFCSRNTCGTLQRPSAATTVTMSRMANEILRMQKDCHDPFTFHFAHLLFCAAAILARTDALIFRLRFFGLAAGSNVFATNCPRLATQASTEVLSTVTRPVHGRRIRLRFVHRMTATVIQEPLPLMQG